MCYDYGFGELGNKLIKLFRSGPPDFEAAEDLIRQGADLNTIGTVSDDDNILSTILQGYWWSEFEDQISSDYVSPDQALNINPNLGPAMCSIIRFFLDHGFDVTKLDGCFGAQCLWALTLSTFDRYIIEATKMLLDAGAKNRPITPGSTDIADTPWDFIATEGSYQDCCEENHALANVYEAVYQIYQAIEDGRPYGGIDSYVAAFGKKIRKVLAKQIGDSPIFFPMNMPSFKKCNCYKTTLYFLYDGGTLITTQYADFWTDTILPDSDLVDVSDHFNGIVGNKIQRLTYDHRNVVKGTTKYGQPITTIEMDNGNKARFSINFGEVNTEDRAAFYQISGT